MRKWYVYIDVKMRTREDENMKCRPRLLEGPFAQNPSGRKTSGLCSLALAAKAHHIFLRSVNLVLADVHFCWKNLRQENPTGFAHTKLDIPRPLVKLWSLPTHTGQSRTRRSRLSQNSVEASNKKVTSGSARSHYKEKESQGPSPFHLQWYMYLKSPFACPQVGLAPHFI